MMSQAGKRFVFEVAEAESGERLDVFLSEQDISLTRSQVKRLADEGKVWVNSLNTKAGYRLRTGDSVVILKEAPREYSLVPEEIPLDILFEDKAIVVVNKPPGMVVHPAAGNYQGTLVHALLFHCKDLSGIGGVLRPGIVHRLDKNTSGLMVVAKSDQAHTGLVKQFKKHLVKKDYRALVHGDVKAEGVVDLSIGRHPVDGKRMSTKSRRGKEALTRWKVVERYGPATLLDIEIETGRTHQIRVHMNAVGHPVVGDTVYGNSKKRVNSVKDISVRNILKEMGRQALHSRTIGFFHPITEDYMEFSSSLPYDISSVCEKLGEYAFKKDETGNR
jgi:23S rRNA pseudouridine1911/1915/1917 synthase